MLEKLDLYFVVNTRIQVSDPQSKGPLVNFFQELIRVSNGLDPDPNYAAVIWFQTVFKGYQQTKKFSPSQERVDQVCSVCYDKNVFAMIKTCLL